MAFIVKVEGWLTAGANRGGEDLHLVFLVDCPSSPLEVIEGGGPLDFAHSFELELSEDFKELKGSTPPGNSPLFKLELGEYGFHWKGTKESLRDLVSVELLRDENWSRPGLTGSRCVFKFVHFVAGNAD